MGRGVGLGGVCVCVRLCMCTGMFPDFQQECLTRRRYKALNLFLSPPEQDLGAYEVKLRLPSGDELPVKVNVVKR